MTINPPHPRRATSLAELDATLDLMFTEASWDHGLAFQPRPSDIIISPYGKSGTTWLQQIVHGLRSGGRMDFDEITAVTPWIETALTFGWDLEADQVASPRVFKSHLSWDLVPKGGRYIVSIRTPVASRISGYRFFEDWLFEPGSISIDDYIRSRMPTADDPNRGNWHHIASWWSQRDNPDALLLCYEAMVADQPAAVRQVAAFMGIAPGDPVIDVATRQSTREFMLANKDHFDDKYMRNHAETHAGVPPLGISHKVTAGTADQERYTFSPDVLAEMDRLWAEQVTPVTGLSDYEALREALRN